MFCQRQPLRDRCNVFLRVSTDRKHMATSTKSKLPPNLVSSAGNTPPPVVGTSQRRMSQMQMTMATPAPPLPIVSPSVLDTYTGTPTEPGLVRQFIPHLYLSSPPGGPDVIPAGKWTHVLRILPASKAHSAGTSTITDVPAGSGPAGTQILDLHVGRSSAKTATTDSEKENSANGGGLPLPLRKLHLLLARDFLALALPYYASAHPVETFLPSPAAPVCDFPTDAVRVLLVGPPRALLAIALTYIAYASESTVAHVMRCVVEEGEDGEACALLGPDANMGLAKADLDVLERVAHKGL
ncbi:hypothetical protein C8R46DRAFT_1206227 [Mycena filopes]|nr:hypothetical protein C8R46DRAFT_1206227 [Mycena filopes]